METAKVDIRKLQVLNDCINRTIEALNQVRLSVHAGGISPQVAPHMFGVVPGIGHTAPIANSVYSQLAQQAAYANPIFNGVAGIPTATPYAFAAQTGLGHTAFDPRVGLEMNDPYTTARISQTFPFVHWGYSPFAWPSV